MFASALSFNQPHSDYSFFSGSYSQEWGAANDFCRLVEREGRTHHLATIDNNNPKTHPLLSLDDGQHDIYPHSKLIEHPQYFLSLHRQRIPMFGTLDASIDLIRTAKRVIVVSGAGISVSAGIPDFRSEGGLYSIVKSEHPTINDPTDLFDLETFKRDPSLFYSFAHRIWDPTVVRKPSFAHRFIKELETRDQLLRGYSQNIDLLEAAAGIGRTIQCHGSFSRCRCIGCGVYHPTDSYITKCVRERSVPYCPSCNNPLKPDIVFFGEDLTAEFDTTIDGDLATADLLIVMGSSLKVDPVASIVRDLPPHVPQILINREVVAAPHEFDLCLLSVMTLWSS